MVGNNSTTLQGELVIRLLNRLSDYLFVLARKFTQDKNAMEVPWMPRK
jgi:cob(I)alamin adenosyltransferase